MLTESDKQWITQQLTDQLGASERRMAERIEVTETRLLTEFHKWAQQSRLS